MDRCCSTCEHFDGDCHCTLPVLQQLITGSIVDPDRVVCDKHELSESDRKDAEQFESLKAEDQARTTEGIAYENSLYRLGGQY